LLSLLVAPLFAFGLSSGTVSAWSAASDRAAIVKHLDARGRGHDGAGAREFDLDTEFSTSVVLLSTLLSPLTLVLLIALPAAPLTVGRLAGLKVGLFAAPIWVTAQTRLRTWSVIAVVDSVPPDLSSRQPSVIARSTADSIATASFSSFSGLPQEQRNRKIRPDGVRNSLPGNVRRRSVDRFCRGLGRPHRVTPTAASPWIRSARRPRR
jgi:hypothetical protein